MKTGPKSKPTVDPVYEALMNPKPRTEPMSEDLRAQGVAGLADVKARRFVDVYGVHDRLQN